MSLVIIVLAGMIVLSELGVAIAPLIASIGVLGLAVGFGSQKRVPDVITGVFIQLDNAMKVGDTVTAAGVPGKAEHVDIRSTAIRSLEGTLHVVRFSMAEIISNNTREYGNYVGEYQIDLENDIDDAFVALRAAYDKLRADPEYGPDLLDDLAIRGMPMD